MERSPSLDRIVQFALNATAPLIGLLAIPLITRFYGSAVFAQYSQLAIAVVVIGLVLSARLELLVPTAAASGRLPGLFGNIRATLAVSLPLTLVAAAVLCLMPGNPGVGGLAPLVALGGILIVGFVGSWLTSLLIVLVGSKGRPRRLGTARIAQAIVLFGSQLVLWTVIDPLFALLVGLVLGYLASLAVLSLGMDQKERSLLLETSSERYFKPRESLRYGLSLVPVSIFGQFNTMGGPLILFSYLYGPALAGLAFLSFRVIASAAVALSMVVEAAVYQALASPERGPSHASRLLRRWSLAMIVAGIAAIVLWYLVGWRIVVWALPPAWTGVIDFIPPSIVAWTAQLIFAPTLILWSNRGQSKRVLAVEFLRTTLTLSALAIGWAANLEATLVVWMALATFAGVTLLGTREVALSRDR